MRRARRRRLGRRYEASAAKVILDVLTMPDAKIQRNLDRIAAFLGSKSVAIKGTTPGLRASLDRIHARYGRVLQAVADERE